MLDPACGSGNFLYVTLQRLKDLEKEVILFPRDNGLGAFLPLVGPWQLQGIEINPYAYDLAQMTVWIGWLQWVRTNGFGVPSEPILRPLDKTSSAAMPSWTSRTPPIPKSPTGPRWTSSSEIRHSWVASHASRAGGRVCRQTASSLPKPNPRAVGSLLLLV